MPVDTVSVTLSNGAAGALTAGSGGTVGVDGVLRVTGSPTQVQAALQTLAFTPADLAASQIATSGATISVIDGTISATDSKTSLIVVGANPGSPAPGLAPAVEVLNSAATLTLANVRVGATDLAALSLSNGATAPAATLSVVPTATGAAIASGTIAGLAAGATDATSILAGIATASAGAHSGTVTLAGTSVASGVGTTLANPPTVAVSGSVYREATGTIAPISTIVHVGDSGTLALTVANTAASDGYSEALVAAIAGASGAVAAGAAGPTADIAAGAASNALTITVPTTAAGVEAGTATLTLTSDGGTGAGAIDGLGTVALGTVDVPVSVTVDNAATAAVSANGPGLTPTVPNTWVLDLGTLTAGVPSAAVAISATNAALGPADALDDAFAVTNGGAFVDTGFAGITGLAVGGLVVAGTIVADTTTLGINTETIVVSPTGTNATGYSHALAPLTIDVTATIVAAPTVAPAGIGLVAPASGTLVLGNVVVGASDTHAIDVANTATAPAGGLDVTATTSGAATASGSISLLAAGFSDATDLVVGLDTSTAGLIQGTVTLQASSVVGVLTTDLSPGPTIAVSGSVYRRAGDIIQPLNATLHVGASGILPLVVANSAAADGYSEALIAAVAGVSGAVGTQASGPTGDILAGGTNTALSVVVPTSTAGVDTGMVALALDLRRRHRRGRHRRARHRRARHGRCPGQRDGGQLCHRDPFRHHRRIADQDRRQQLRPQLRHGD